jgi:hypothetical protein
MFPMSLVARTKDVCPKARRGFHKGSSTSKRDSVYIHQVILCTKPYEKQWEQVKRQLCTSAKRAMGTLEPSTPIQTDNADVWLKEVTQ